MTTIYADKVVIVNRSRSKKKKKRAWKEGDPINWHGYKFTHQIHTLEGRNAIQNDLRAIMFSLMDCSGGEMVQSGEMETWKGLLWNMSEKFGEFYGKKHSLGVWNH